MGGHRLKPWSWLGRILHVPHVPPRKPRNVDFLHLLDLRSCPDEYSSNTGFQEHSSGQSSLSSVLD